MAEVAKDIAKQVFTNLGFTVDEIPVGKGRSADLRVTDAADTYLVEVKEKFESEEDAKERTELLSTGDVVQEEAPLWHDNRISAILRDAQKQLDQTAKDHSNSFQLIWFHASGIDAGLKGMQAFSTFYGDVPVSARWPHEPGTKHCFYFDYSAAFAMRTIEALFLSERDSLQVCLNECSLRAAEFRRTALFQKLKSLGAVFDPLELAAAGEIIFCRANIPRRDDNLVAKALQDQTGVLYSAIRMKRYTSSVVVRP